MLVLPGTTTITLIIPASGLRAASLLASRWPWWPLEWCRRCFSFSFLN